MSHRGRFHRLGLKIITWSFVPTAIILVAVAMMMLYSYQQVTEALVIERDQELTRLLASQLASELGGFTDSLADVARLPGMISRDDAALESSLESAADALSVFDAGVVVLDVDGIVIASMPERQAILGHDWSDRSYYREARAAREVFSDSAVDGPDGSEVVVAAVPLRSHDGEFLGVIAGMFLLGDTQDSGFYSGVERRVGREANPPENPYYLDELSRARADRLTLAGLYDTVGGARLTRMRISGSGTAYLVDGDARVIYHPDVERIGDRLLTHTAVRHVLLERVGAVRTRDIDGREIVASFAPVPGTSWGLIVEENWDSLIEASRNYTSFLFLLLALGVIVPALVVTLGVRRITRPVAQLISGAQRVAAGSFGHQIRLATRDELRDLAEQFNRMSGQLRESYALLEQRVHDRTEELGTLYAVASQVNRSLDTETVLCEALTETMRYMGANVGAACRVDEGADDSYVLACRSDVDGYVDCLLEMHEPVREQLRAHLEPTLWNAGQPICQLLAGHSDDDERQGCVSVPLLARDRVLGSLVLRTSDERLGEETLSLLSSIGRQVGLALENAMLYNQARQAAMLAERQRLARDLHDSVTQSLYGVLLYAKASARLLASGRNEMAVERLESVQQSALEALQEMRLLIYELRPSVLEAEGLAAALQSRIEAVEERAGLEAHLRIGEDIDLGAEREEALYRIAQEALNNVLKHAQARRVDVRLESCNGTVELEIRDDGAGCDPSDLSRQGGFGWQGMRERADEIGARLTVESCEGEGTCVRVELTR